MLRGWRRLVRRSLARDRRPRVAPAACRSPVAGIKGETVADMLWDDTPDDPVQRAAQGATQASARLAPPRSQSAADPLPGSASHGEKVVWLDTAVVSSDVHEFTELLNRGKASSSRLRQLRSARRPWLYTRATCWTVRTVVVTTAGCTTRIRRLRSAAQRLPKVVTKMRFSNWQACSPTVQSVGAGSGRGVVLRPVRRGPRKTSARGQRCSTSMNGPGSSLGLEIGPCDDSAAPWLSFGTTGCH